MGPNRSSNLSAAITITEETTPKPASAVSPIASTEPSRQRAERNAALVEYFSNPSAEMRAADEAWKEALARYGDEDSDAWVSALEDGTHPLCRAGATARPA